ncbi:MAG: RHS repeat protein, partial [Deltaproteobacteria bacterium]|nr:RHS repeat protein [Deltaproteobacteria bacterium]
PDGINHDVELDYTGVRATTKTVSIGSTRPGGTVVESQVSTEEVRDRQGRTHQVIERSSSDETITTTYGYDVTGELSTVQVESGAASQSRSFSYDGRGFLLLECQPELGVGGNGCISYNAYDAMGNLLEKTDGDTTYAYTYDRAGRLTEIEVTRDGVTYPARQLTYCNAVGLPAECTQQSLGKLLRAVSHNHYNPATPAASLPITETYEYNGIGGAVSKRTTEFPLLPFGASIEQHFTWTQLGNLASMDYPLLTPTTTQPEQPIGPIRAATYSYTWGWLSSASLGGRATSMSYHENGMLSQLSHSNGVTDTFGLDTNSMQRPASITVTGPDAGTWTTGTISYDGAGNITTMGDDWFLYDGLSRLTQAHLADINNNSISDSVDLAYRYDPFGNRTDTFWSTTDEQGGLSSSWYRLSVDPATNRLQSETYDSSGNMTSLLGDQLAWYPFNQLR